ncbi:hypothetical protein ACEWY4_010012 [Coilia grayii]|uniref:PDZ domain-containing protein n=1 Tax=Coilia grayii TaxID=363190 RepID=A0ABD1K827_9TELE
MPQTVTLSGPSPWGFRLVGGRDFSTPLTISRITPGSKAALGDLCPGDTILAINGESTDALTHMEAQNRIKACKDQLVLDISRSENKVWSPAVSEDGKTSPFSVCSEPDSQVKCWDKFLFTSYGTVSFRLAPAQLPLQLSALLNKYLYHHDNSPGAPKYSFPEKTGNDTWNLTDLLMYSEGLGLPDERGSCRSVCSTGPTATHPQPGAMLGNRRETGQ